MEELSEAPESKQVFFFQYTAIYVDACIRLRGRMSVNVLETSRAFLSPGERERFFVPKIAVGAVVGVGIRTPLLTPVQSLCTHGTLQAPTETRKHPRVVCMGGSRSMGREVLVYVE